MSEQVTKDEEVQQAADQMSTEEACVRGVQEGMLSAFIAVERQIHVNVSSAFSQLNELSEHITNRCLADLGVEMPEESQKFWDDQAKRLAELKAQQEAHKEEVLAKADEMLGEDSDGNAE